MTIRSTARVTTTRRRSIPGWDHAIHWEHPTRGRVLIGWVAKSLTYRKPKPHANRRLGYGVVLEVRWVIHPAFPMTITRRDFRTRSMALEVIRTAWETWLGILP